jgi:hypothetical protein
VRIIVTSSPISFSTQAEELEVINDDERIRAICFLQLFFHFIFSRLVIFWEIIVFCSNLVLFFSEEESIVLWKCEYWCGRAYLPMHTIAGPCRIRAICFLAFFFVSRLRICETLLLFFSEGDSIVLCRCEHWGGRAYLYAHNSRIRAVCFLPFFFLLRICKKVLCSVPVFSRFSV